MAFQKLRISLLINLRGNTMTFEEYWKIVDKKTGETVTKEQLKYFCEMAYGQGEAKVYAHYYDPEDEDRWCGY